jgi:predicted transcriptional regulator
MPRRKVKDILPATQDQIDNIVGQFDEPIPIAKIIELRNKNLTYEQIGQLLGCTKQNIAYRLQMFKPAIDNLPSIKELRADNLAVVSSTILNSLTPEDIKKSTGYQKVGMFSLLYDKERLERGQSTENISHLDISKNLSDLLAELKSRGIDSDTSVINEADVTQVSHDD